MQFLKKLLNPLFHSNSLVVLSVLILCGTLYIGEIQEKFAEAEQAEVKRAAAANAVAPEPDDAVKNGDEDKDDAADKEESRSSLLIWSLVVVTAVWLARLFHIFADWLLMLHSPKRPERIAHLMLLIGVLVLFTLGQH